jgi:hypothetical protein
MMDKITKYGLKWISFIKSIYTPNIWLLCVIVFIIEQNKEWQLQYSILIVGSIWLWLSEVRRINLRNTEKTETKKVTK